MHLSIIGQNNSSFRVPVISGCQFHPVGDYLRFVRVPENVPVGGEILRVQVQPKGLLSIQPMDKVKYEEN